MHCHGPQERLAKERWHAEQEQEQEPEREPSPEPVPKRPEPAPPARQPAPPVRQPSPEPVRQPEPDDYEPEDNPYEMGESDPVPRKEEVFEDDENVYNEAVVEQEVAGEKDLNDYDSPETTPAAGQDGQSGVTAIALYDYQAGRFMCPRLYFIFFVKIKFEGRIFHVTLPFDCLRLQVVPQISTMLSRPQGGGHTYTSIHRFYRLIEF
jgi:hypothetical protein